MADYTQSKSVLIAHQNVANPESVEGSPADVSTAIEALVICRHAYREAVDPGGIEPEFHIVGSLDASGADGWFLIHTFKCADPGAAPATEALTATEPLAEKVLAVASTTGFAAGDEIYVEDTGTAADSEWQIIDRVVANTSVDIFFGLAAAKDNADVLWGSAQTFKLPIPCGVYKRINVLYSNEGSSAPNTAVLAEILIATDIE